MKFSGDKRIWIVGALALFLTAGAFWYFDQSRRAGAYELVALRLNESARESCDEGAKERRLFLARLIDTYRPRIQGLWKNRKSGDFPEFKMEQVGPLFLRVNQGGEAKSAFEQTSWSWEEAHSTYLRTQMEPNSPETKQRWRDLDTAVRFLLERDVARVLLGRKFLPPEATEHKFRRSSSVKRTGPKEYELSLDAGDFRGSEPALERVFAREWNTKGYRLRIRWVSNDPEVYVMKAHFQSGRSFVNHRRKEMVIANFAWIRTVDHELGHILGFDDHYYSVWSERNCYYSQESRLGDLMSNSDQGRVTNEHWRILDRAYPLQEKTSEAREETFPYFFGR